MSRFSSSISIISISIIIINIISSSSIIISINISCYGTGWFYIQQVESTIHLNAEL